MPLQQVPAARAHGRVLAQDVYATMDQPPFDRSPLDGYALIAADSAGASPERPVRLQVVGKVCAGGCFPRRIERGQAVRVMTGAMLPPGCDCVIRQEDTDLGADFVEIRAQLRHHQNYCFKGEDFCTGDLLMPAGTVLDAVALGVLASAGAGPESHARLEVLPQLRAAVLSTGDELSPGDVRPLAPGKIYDANRVLVTARLEELGVKVIRQAHLPDDPALVCAALADACQQVDILITTGGVSVGEKDIFHEALPLLGAEQVFWRVQCKPGTPALFSVFQGRPILSLSGNPFAAAATFEILGRPLLHCLSPDPRLSLCRKQAVLASEFAKASPVRRFIRGRYEQGAVALPRQHSSGQLASMLGCNCLVDIPAGSGPLQAGETVSALLL